MVFAVLLLSLCFAILFSVATPIVTSKKHIGVLERQDFAADRVAIGSRQRIFYVQLKDERVIVVLPFGIPFRKGENVVVFEDIQKSGLRKFRYAGYDDERNR